MLLPSPSSESREATILAIKRDKKITKVFTTPCISVMVTMSPLAMWLTSCANTASASSRVMLCSNPVETATRESSRFAPVANAFMSGAS
ncbi:Uncharacterised protein [Vibrio cholerae]|nr:Uncharacterised protein [Vibrio cholerae]CSD16979.1 Uncharacterised protein [Vibrio cholerae]CSI50969.1 Uncharacterised protein [Vibrio cholerae]